METVTDKKVNNSVEEKVEKDVVFYGDASEVNSVNQYDYNDL